MILMLLVIGVVHIPWIIQQCVAFISLEQLCVIGGWTLSIGAYLGFIVQSVRVTMVDKSVDALKQMNESWVRNKADSLCTKLLVS